MTTTDENYCVYIHRNIVNNKSYIGISRYGNNPNKRWQNGKGYVGQQLFYNAIQKHGWDNFEHIIWANGLSLVEAQKIEIMLIALFDTTNRKFGYNVSSGGDGFSLNEVDIVKRTVKSLETRNKNRIQKSIDMFKDRFDNGDENILVCQMCGAYFEKDNNKQVNVKKSGLKRKSYSRKRKYCDYCATYHRHNQKIITCIDCGIEFVVKSRDNATNKCEKCKNNNYPYDIVLK